MTITNSSPLPILTDGKTKEIIKLTPVTEISTESPPTAQPSFYQPYQKQNKVQPLDSETINLIKYGEMDPQLKDILVTHHRKYREVFSGDLCVGYNGYFGPHVCRLNWSTAQRPQAKKFPVASYDHKLKGLMQEICDDLTDQGVLKVPQEHNITVQSVCPSFLKRKRRASGKAKHPLTKNYCRLLVNFGPVNHLIKNIPTPTAIPDDVYNKLGR